MMWCIEICDPSSDAFPVVWQQSSMCRHESSDCYNLAICGHIFIKFLSHDSSHTLYTFACQYWTMVIVPPTANSKLKVLYFYALCHAGSPDSPQIWSAKMWDVDNVILWNFWPCVKQCCHGNTLFVIKYECVFEWLGMLRISWNLADGLRGADPLSSFV